MSPVRTKDVCNLRWRIIISKLEKSLNNICLRACMLYMKFGVSQYSDIFRARILKAFGIWRVISRYRAAIFRQYIPWNVNYEGALRKLGLFGESFATTGVRKRRQIFSKSYQVKPKSDCIYYFPIYLEHQMNTDRLLFHINRKRIIFYPNLVSLNNIYKIFICVFIYTDAPHKCSFVNAGYLKFTQIDAFFIIDIF